MQEFQQNAQLELAEKFVRFTQKNIFLTGKAGTGKTTFLHNLRKTSPKRMVVVAPTGVAAINAQGVTIHSFFQLNFGPQIPNEYEKKGFQKNERFSRDKLNIIRSLDLLVIDEISMVRADILDAIDKVLRRLRYSSEPFGGVQLLMIGDLQQLSPVAKADEWEMLKAYYDSVYFFSSLALKKTDYVSIELNHIYRQSDDVFISLLNAIRDNELNQSQLNALNERYIPDFNPPDEEGYITLTTHNRQASEINERKLNAIKNKSYFFDAEVRGDFPEYLYPNDVNLELKEGAQVMFIKNDISPEKLFYNGKIGSIERIEDSIVYVKCKGESESIAVEPLAWENTKYTLDDETKEIKEEFIGSFKQYPLKTAWAITIHKSQGLTFEKAIIDSASAFAHGQVYVALSRCKSLEGMVLRSPLHNGAVICDNTVSDYNRFIAENQPDEARFKAEKKLFQQNLLLELFDYKELLFAVRKCIRIVKENFKNPDAYLDELLDLEQKLASQIVPIGEKFKMQIVNAFGQADDLEQNAFLLERLQKGSDYFLDLLAKYLAPGIANIELDSDNKTVLSRITTEKEKMWREAVVKKACMQHTRERFVLAEFLSLRAKAKVDELGQVKQKKSSEKLKFPELYERLIDWRTAEAQKHGVEVSDILHKKALVLLTNACPASKTQLAEVKGIGVKTIEKYGDSLLDCIVSFIAENRESVIKKKEGKGATYDYTLSLINEGKNIEAIAKERNMATSTIEGHVAKLIESGKLNPNKLMSSNQISILTDFVGAHPNKSLTELKSIAGDDFSYGELKLGMAILNSKTTKAG